MQEDNRSPLNRSRDILGEVEDQVWELSKAEKDVKAEVQRLTALLATKANEVDQLKREGAHTVREELERLKAELASEKLRHAESIKEQGTGRVDLVRTRAGANRTRWGLTNLIFLDIDGVLNNRRSMCAAFDPSIRLCPFPHQITRTVDPYCVSLLNVLIRDTSALVVISSTWRMYHPETIRPCLEWGGFYYGDRIIGQTPINEESRGVQIQEWLMRRYESGGDAFRYVILDDDSDFSPAQRSRHIKTDHEVGLTVYDVVRAKALMLEGK